MEASLGNIEMPCFQLAAMKVKRKRRGKRRGNSDTQLITPLGTDGWFIVWTEGLQIFLLVTVLCADIAFLSGPRSLKSRRPVRSRGRHRAQ